MFSLDGPTGFKPRDPRLLAASLLCLLVAVFCFLFLMNLPQGAKDKANVPPTTPRESGTRPAAGRQG